MCQYYTYLSVIIKYTWCTVCLMLLCNYIHVSVILIFRFDILKNHVKDAKLEIKNVITHTRTINFVAIILLNLHVSDVEVKRKSALAYRGFLIVGS